MRQELQRLPGLEGPVGSVEQGKWANKYFNRIRAEGGARDRDESQY